MAFPSKITQQPQTASDSLSKTFLMSCLGGWGGGGGIFNHISATACFFRILCPFFDFTNAVCSDLSLSTIFDSFSCVKHIFVHYFFLSTTSPHNRPARVSLPVPFTPMSDI